MKNYFRIEKTLMLLFMLCLFPIGMLAQNVLKGTVSDAGGEPIIGASVVTKNNQSGRNKEESRGGDHDSRSHSRVVSRFDGVGKLNNH